VIDSLVCREPPLVANEEVWHEEAASASVALVPALLAAPVGADLLETLAEEKHCNEAGVHHDEVHGAGLLEGEGAVLVEDAKRYTHYITENHFASLNYY